MNKNELLCNKNKKICSTLYYIQRFLTLAFAVTLFPFLPFHLPLPDIFEKFMCSTIRVNICAIIATIKKV